MLNHSIFNPLSSHYPSTILLFQLSEFYPLKLNTTGAIYRIKEKGKDIVLYMMGSNLHDKMHEKKTEK